MAISVDDDIQIEIKDTWVNIHVGMRNIKKGINEEIDRLQALKNLPDYGTTASASQKKKVNDMINALQSMKALITDDMLDKKL